MELSKKTKEYWREVDWQDLKKDQSIPDLYHVASRILARLPEELIFVCGPITTGGKGNVEDNINDLNNKIIELQAGGRDVFDQMPFEDPMHKMMLAYLAKNEYMTDILTQFYQPLFETGRIVELHFLPDWQTSRGATWEHEQAVRLGIKIVYC